MPTSCRATTIDGGDFKAMAAAGGISLPLSRALAMRDVCGVHLHPERYCYRRRI
jgi:hypothetical protein